MAGVPFEAVEALATRETFIAARKLLVRQEPSDADSDFEDTLNRELGDARTALWKSAQEFLPPYLIFGAEGPRERLIGFLAKTSSESGPLPPRKKDQRARERSLLLYLQRVAAKNDSLSEFGPCSWGTVADVPSIEFAPRPGVAKRESFLERWTAHGIAAAMNADPAVRPELRPRLNPNGRIEGADFVFTDTGDRKPLASEQLAVLARCDGGTPTHSLGAADDLLVDLAQQEIILWEAEVPALDPYAFATLISEIKNWRDNPVRADWLERLEPIAALPGKFIQSSDPALRAEVMDNARHRLQQLGSERVASDRFLYSAINPIGEECFRQSDFRIAPNFVDEVTVDGEPWIDLWRDSYAFVAGRVAAGLRGVLEKMSIQDGTAPLPAFLHACETANLSLTGPGLVALATIAFQEVKAAFRQRLNSHSDKSEYELTADDCRFVRQNFAYEKFDEYTYPSADIQLAAKSIEAVARGDYQWILAELHPPVAMLHHGFYWSCPDKAALSDALSQTVFGRPGFHFGFFAADFTATTTVHLFDIPGLRYNFVAPQRGHPDWPTVRPADTEVYVDPTSGDVCLRKIDNHQHLGSFARAWLIPLGFHPFFFSLGPNTPRLRCGKVIVQRRAWTVSEEELGRGDFTGVSRDLVLAVERLRAQKNWPRHIYIRPTEQALRRSGAEGRDKDTKPVYVDLESYMFLEIFHRWLTKAGELEVTEMLPAPEDLLWQEADGRRTFELRTQIIPRA